MQKLLPGGFAVLERSLNVAATKGLSSDQSNHGRDHFIELCPPNLGAAGGARGGPHPPRLYELRTDRGGIVYLLTRSAAPGEYLHAYMVGTNHNTKFGKYTSEKRVLIDTLKRNELHLPPFVMVEREVFPDDDHANDASEESDSASAASQEEEEKLATDPHDTSAYSSAQSYEDDFM